MRGCFDKHFFIRGIFLIKINNVNFLYASEDEGALKNINLNINDNEFVLLLGSSGSGKTSITRLFNALIPDFYDGNLSGSITVDGKSTAEYTIQELSHTVGSVFQDPRSQFFAMDTTGEIAFSCENAGLKREETLSRIKDAVELFEIERLLGKSVLSLSSGEKQMIAVASVYARRPKILVFDEPSANLDNNSVERLRKILKKLKDKGHTIIISEHRIHYLSDLCDRAVIIENGEIKQEMSGDMLRNQTNEALHQIGLRAIHMDGFLNIQNKVKLGTSLLKLKNISFQYKNSKRLLENVSMEVSGGEILGITGQNGTGKTTLLEIICGIKKQNNGDIYIRGKNCKAKDRIKNTYLVMQDSDYQLFTESVEKEIALGCKTESGLAAKGKKVLESMNLIEYSERHPASLSGGQKQRLCIAVACMKEADIICFDEPTSGLDYNSMLNVVRLLADLAIQGKAVIVTSHDHEFMSLCCTDIYGTEIK